MSRFGTRSDPVTIPVWYFKILEKLTCPVLIPFGILKFYQRGRSESRRQTIIIKKRIGDRNLGSKSLQIWPLWGGATILTPLRRVFETMFESLEPILGLHVWTKSSHQSHMGQKAECDCHCDASTLIPLTLRVSTHVHTWSPEMARGGNRQSGRGHTVQVVEKMVEHPLGGRRGGQKWMSVVWCSQQK